MIMIIFPPVSVTQDRFSPQNAGNRTLTDRNFHWIFVAVPTGAAGIYTRQTGREEQSRKGLGLEGVVPEEPETRGLSPLNPERKEKNSHEAQPLQGPGDGPHRRHVFEFDRWLLAPQPRGRRRQARGEPGG